MDRLKIGVIGTGRFGDLHIKVFKQIKNCNVLAVADIDKEKVQKIAREHNIYKTYTSPDSLISDKEIDTVSIVSDEDTHGELAIKAIKNNKNVFIEKPIATSYEEAKEIERLSYLHDVIVMVGNISRFSTPYYSIKRSINNNELGDIATIIAKRNFSKSWFENFGKRVHPVYESGIHDIDLLIWYINSPCIEVYAVDKNESGYKYPDSFLSILKFKNGTIATISSAWLYPEKGPRNLIDTLNLDGTIDAQIEVVGNKGTASYSLNHPGYSIWSEDGVKQPEMTLWTTEIEGIGGAIRNELEHFVSQVIRQEESTVAPVKHSVEALKIANAIVLSVQRGENIYLEEEG